MNKLNLDTPCLVLDKQKLEDNLALMQKLINSEKKQARPHTKTHKCSELAKLQIAQGAIGVSAAKVTEALVLAQNGIKNTLITSPIVTNKKLANLVSCRTLDPGLILVCDSKQNADQLNKTMQAHGLTLNTLVDIDSGIGRTGVAFKDAIALGEYIHQNCDNLKLQGIQCYAGNLQHIADFNKRKAASLSVMEQAAQMRKLFIKEGLPCEILTGSGTGTFDIDMQLTEVTEVQPGSYTVMDMEYHNIGSRSDDKKFTLFKPAMTMLTTVISANHNSHVTVDAGTKSIYFDPTTKPLIISHPGLHYDWNGFGDEHGKVTANPGFSLPKVGEVIELVVPHCDPTINLHSHLHLIEENQVVNCWEIDMRGCVR